MHSHSNSLSKKYLSKNTILFGFLLYLFCICSSIGYAQDSENSDVEKESTTFRSSRAKYFDLIHTKLEVSFDWKNEYLLGTASITLTPHFYMQSTLELDAKGMEIHNVSVKKDGQLIQHNFTYDTELISIEFVESIKRRDTLLVTVNYTAKPNERVVSGSDAIKSDKGLYFINADGTDKYKPMQIWTQGETQSNSVWFPTIDAPNQKSTQEMIITVDDKFSTLSNGVLKKQVNNPDGTRTDYWEMQKPHAPYLFMMAVGEYSIVEDTWNDIPLYYYVEPQFESNAKQIFGNTPEMMTYFSELLGYEFPWSKYAQVIVRDYVSGAMENTTASVFMESVQSTERELLDFNWDDIIAHELFHHWFGDLVTCESWSHLTLNEGFATYSEYLWDVYKYGQDEADFNFEITKAGYLSESEEDPKRLIRYYYNDREDMFDSHSYGKGALVFHMLRTYLGDEAFFAGLNHYLNTYEYGTTELTNLRLSFEKISGEDLLWFFDQWFLFPGHPKIDVVHKYDSDTLVVEIQQTQDFSISPLYRLPLFIDVWKNGARDRYPLVIEDQNETYKFPLDERPDFIQFDGELQLLGEINHDKSDRELMNQFFQNPRYVAKTEVFDRMDDFENDSIKHAILNAALSDEFFVFRYSAIDYLSNSDLSPKKYIDRIVQMVKDSNPYVRASAITFLANEKFNKYREIIQSAFNDRSYTVIGSAVDAFVADGKEIDNQMISTLKNENNIQVVLPLAQYFIDNKTADTFDWFEGNLNALKGTELFYFIQTFSQKLIDAPDTERTSSVELFDALARNNSNYIVRLSAYQALMLMTDIKGVKAMLSEIRKGEKDERLLELYEQM